MEGNIDIFPKEEKAAVPVFQGRSLFALFIQKLGHDIQVPIRAVRHVDLPAEGSLHLKSHSQVEPQGWGVAGVHLQAQLGDALAEAPPLLNLQQPPPQAPVSYTHLGMVPPLVGLGLARGALASRIR